MRKDLYYVRLCHVIYFPYSNSTMCNTTNSYCIVVFNTRTIYCPESASYVTHLPLEFIKILLHDTSFVNNNGLIATYGSSIIEVINRFYWREKRGGGRSQVICQEVSGFKLTGAC